MPSTHCVVTARWLFTRHRRSSLMKTKSFDAMEMKTKAKALRLGTQCPAEILENAAEIGEGGGIGAVGPEGAGEPVAGEFGAGAQGKEGGEPLGFTGAQAREGRVAEARLEGAEEVKR